MGESQVKEASKCHVGDLVELIDGKGKVVTEGRFRIVGELKRRILVAPEGARNATNRVVQPGQYERSGTRPNPGHNRPQV